ncbi:MAG: hypothetical protein K6A39_04475 [Clostridiales bacterium]|nr:hypothetical protein [Clostridiales bacterium]
MFLVFPRKHRWIALLISSVAFFLISAKELILFILFTSATVFFAAGLIEKTGKQGDDKLKTPGLEKEDKKKIRKETSSRRRLILILTIVLNIGILVFFKVFGFFTAAWEALTKLFQGGAADVPALLVPLGISYYTFSATGYLLDIYWKRYAPEKNYLRFLLFLIYFPHILQGPISRYPKLGQELKKSELRLTWDNVAYGTARILLGCFKKLVIADRAGIFVSDVMKTPGLTGGVYLAALILDAIQIYMDFSGYMEIMCGVSRIFNVELEPNFNLPFLAVSVPDFWRRWHMSLGSWFRDYVYYPLTVSSWNKKITKATAKWKGTYLKKIAAVILPVLITWILTGLWHGTGPGYVMWGVYYGILIALSVTLSDKVQEILGKAHVKTDSVWYRIFRTVKIFIIFMGGRFLASSVSFSQKGQILRRLFTSPSLSGLMDCGLRTKDFAILALGVVLMIVMAVIGQKEDVIDWARKRHPVLKSVMILFLFFMVFLFGIYGSQYDATSFMYQQF